MDSAPQVPPKVFLSYSHDSREHEDALLNLSDRLRADGVDCSIDQYVSSPQEGWVTWMQSQIAGADFVLLACTEIYKTRLEKNEEPGVGLGAIWEGQLIFSELYKLQGRNSKYIPVVRTRAEEQFIPSILAAYTHYNLETEEGYNRLYARITGQPEAVRPSLGAIRLLQPKNRIMNSAGSPHNVAARVELVTSATFSYAHPSPPANEVAHENYIRTLVKTLASAKRINAITVEGPEGIGKTTLLAQFSRSLPNQCVSLFVEDDDRSTFDPDCVRLNVSRQAHWILHQSQLQARGVDQETYQGYLDRLQGITRRKRTPVYLLLDGLVDLIGRDAGAASRLVDLLPPPALDGIRYLLSGEADELAPLFGSTSTQFKSFPLVEFDLDETNRLFEGIVADRTILRDLHNACSGNPAFLTSARRLIVRGMRSRDLLGSLSHVSSPFDVEWSVQDRNQEAVRRILAHLAFNDTRSTLADLSAIATIPVAALKAALTSLSVLTIQADDTVRFRARWFRVQAQRELYTLRRSVHKTIAKRLLEHTDTLRDNADIPYHYAAADDHEAVLTHLSPDHVVELIQRAQSIDRVQGAVNLGLVAARHLDKSGDLIRFGLNSAVLNDFFRVGYAVSEVSALSALKDYETAFSIARSAVLKEDRLHLLAIIARCKVQNGDPVEPEVLQQLAVLAGDIDTAPLGRRLVDICTELAVVLPDVALDLAEKTQGEEAERDSVLARLSVFAFATAEERSTALFEKIKSRGHEGRLGVM
jgi:hypothetical protein